jgi:DNA-binding transcriptional MerR regulator
VAGDAPGSRAASGRTDSPTGEGSGKAGIRLSSRRGPATLSISEVARRTGIPITTLRFYEQVLSSLFGGRKTPGGHRRYDEADVARFVTVRRLTASEGVRLSDVRRVLTSRGEQESLREEVERLQESRAADAASLEQVQRRLAALETRIAALEGSPRRRRWLPGRRS